MLVGGGAEAGSETVWTAGQGGAGWVAGRDGEVAERGRVTRTKRESVR